MEIKQLISRRYKLDTEMMAIKIRLQETVCEMKFKYGGISLTRHMMYQIPIIKCSNIIYKDRYKVRIL